MRDFQFGVFVIGLPEPLAEQVDALRQQFDPASAAAAAAHITLTQPLVGEPNDVARADLGAILAEFEPFEVTVGPARAFPGSNVVYLAVEPVGPVLAMRRAAHATGLFRTDLPFTDGFVPHVTVREWPDGLLTQEAVVVAANLTVKRATYLCDAVELWRPDPDGRFGPVDRIVLLGA